MTILSNPADWFAAGRIKATRLLPYFAAQVMSLVPWPAPGLGTLGVTDRSVLLWDPELAKRWSVDELAWVLVHEAEHIRRDHASRRKALAVPQEPGYLKLWNVAADAEINDDLLAAGAKFPQTKCEACGETHGGVTPQHFGSPAGHLAEEYYDHLRRQVQQQKPQPKQGQGQQPGQGQPGQGQQGQGQGQGRGKGKGRGKAPGQQPGQGPQGQGQGQGGASGQSPNPGQSQQQGGGSGRGNAQGPGQSGQGQGQCQGPQPHCGPKGCGSGSGNEPLEAEASIPAHLGKSPAEQQRTRREVAQAVREAAQKGRGTVPAGLSRWAEQLLGPPKVCWRRKLRAVGRRVVAYVLGAGDYTMSRPSRRQGALGYGPGSPVLPALRMPVPQVGVIVDTSGSMGTEELGVALREVKGILEAVGSSVTLLACDADVHALRPVQSVREAIGLLKGGGGTDMRPAFAALARRRPRLDVVVCVTDGMIGDAGPAPRGVRVVWMVCGPHRNARPAPWGDVVEVDAV